VRFFPGYEPTVRVDHLHRATAHPEPLYRFCRTCNFTGQITHWRNGRSMDPLAVPKSCTACDGTGRARTYPATA
jgi:DnaJ-class molecular chaperone